MRNQSVEMSPDEARSFDRYSVSNAARVMAERGCGCEPYVDVFTYRRWLAQGFQVQKGERSIRIPTIRYVERKNRQTGQPERVRLMQTSSVFCRCQVQAQEGTR